MMYTSKSACADDLASRLFQLTRALSLEERNLRNNPAGLSRAADFIEEFFRRRNFYSVKVCD